MKGQNDETETRNIRIECGINVEANYSANAVANPIAYFDVG